MSNLLHDFVLLGWGGGDSLVNEDQIIACVGMPPEEIYTSISHNYRKLAPAVELATDDN